MRRALSQAQALGALAHLSALRQAAGLVIGAVSQRRQVVEAPEIDGGLSRLGATGARLVDVPVTSGGSSVEHPPSGVMATANVMSIAERQTPTEGSESARRLVTRAVFQHRKRGSSLRPRSSWLR